MKEDTFNRQIQMFGEVGNKKLMNTVVSIVGCGGIGSVVLQQLAYLGVNKIFIIDHEELDESNKNRYVTSKEKDIVPGTSKIEIAKRMVSEINSNIETYGIKKNLCSLDAFNALKKSDFIFCCVDNDGARLVFNELCCAYCIPYIDVATEVFNDSPIRYGGHVFTNINGYSCLFCENLIDKSEAWKYLASEETIQDIDNIYGVSKIFLGVSGPAVINLNSAVASLAVTEFICHVLNLRNVAKKITYYAHIPRISVINEVEKNNDCYYCNIVRGTKNKSNIDKYIDLKNVS